MQKRFFALLAAILLPFPLPSRLLADEIGGSGCGPIFTLTGDVSHARYSSEDVSASTAPEIHAEEIYGKQFSAVVEGLPAGSYTVEIHLAEMSKNAPGARVFDVFFGEKLIAKRVDIFEAVGSRREWILTREVQHLGDPINGPFTLSFEARSNNAKFNAIRILDPEGHVVTCANAEDFVNADDEWASTLPSVDAPPIFDDSSHSFEERAADLVRRLSIKEKAQQLMNSAPPIERLRVPGYDYWNECLHGVARAGHATVFPQAIGLAAMWDVDTMHAVADTIATEGRAKNNGFRTENPTTKRYQGLTFWTPNINIFRDPRWGRGHETYGEDPYLTSRLAVSFIQGLQGDDPNYVKAMACAKHFAVHSGPEKLRHSFNAVVSERDFYETYLPQFEAAVTEAKVGIVMSAYNAVQGVPAPADPFLLSDLLRDEWGFDGHVVSDCGAIRDIWHYHQYVETPHEASAIAIRAGNDLNCGRTYKSLTKAVREGFLTEAELDVALQRVLLARFRLGLFDRPEDCEFLSISPELNDTPAHSALALEAARKSIVLLKNDGLLPLQPAALKTLAVIGPNADSVDALVGNYAGTPSAPVTVLEGIRRAVGEQTKVLYAKCAPLALAPGETFPLDAEEPSAALAIAEQADVILYVGGLDAGIEGEEMRVSLDGFDAGDRSRIELPTPQRALLEALVATGRPVVYVNISGGAIAMPWAAEHVDAIFQAWYPGQNGGTAIAELLFGQTNPAGRLPVTFYRSTEDLPDFLDYSMADRTYRYFEGEPLFAFGHGLSYTEFKYGKLKPSAKKIAPDGTLEIQLEVENTGPVAGDEVIQLYVRHLGSDLPQPLQILAGFQRITLEAGASERVTFELPASALRYWDEASQEYVVPKGKFEVRVGASSADIRATKTLAIR